VQQRGDVATRCGVATLPTCIMVNGMGDEVARIIGPQQYDVLRQWILKAMEE